MSPDKNHRSANLTQLSNFFAQGQEQEEGEEQNVNL
jgi:hypothetical protein